MWVDEWFGLRPSWVHNRIRNFKAISFALAACEKADDSRPITERPQPKHSLWTQTPLACACWRVSRLKLDPGYLLFVLRAQIDVYARFPPPKAAQRSHSGNL